MANRKRLNAGLGGSILRIFWKIPGMRTLSRYVAVRRPDSSRIEEVLFSPISFSSAQTRVWNFDSSVISLGRLPIQYPCPIRFRMVSASVFPKCSSRAAMVCMIEFGPIFEDAFISDFRKDCSCSRIAFTAGRYAGKGSTESAHGLTLKSTASVNHPGRILTVSGYTPNGSDGVNGSSLPDFHALGGLLFPDPEGMDALTV